MTLDQNRDDLIRHQRDFADRRGFTYTVLDLDGTVIGCVYIYPLKGVPHAAYVSSWVTAARAELDMVLYRTVTRGWKMPGRSSGSSTPPRNSRR